MNCFDESAEQILREAEHAEKGNWAEYSRLKRILCELGLNEELYYTAVRRLADILGV